MIAIIDYDVGNVSAIANMLHRVGALSAVTSDPAIISDANGIILPGNGAFDPCMRNLRASGLLPLLERRVLHDRIPLLGICVGAQMLGHASEEGSEPGLGWLNVRVKRFPDTPGLPVPHMGWREVCQRNGEHALTQGMAAESRFYFVHSYFLVPVDRSDILMTSCYGIEFAAAVAHANLCGVQFHPEKSHRFGKCLLRNFAKAL